MNNTLHTWQISFGNIVDQNKKTICFLPERKNNDTARLIAAAPDLLSALENLMARCVKDAEHYAPDGNEAIWAFISDASDAICKAKGEA
jgi:hypothetical protein